MPARIMVIDSDASLRELFELFLGDEGWDVSSHDIAHANLAAVQHLKPDLIILDLDVQQRGMAWEFLQLLKMEDTTASIPLLICTTATRLSLEIEGYLAVQHITIVRKPFAVDEIVRIIAHNLASAMAQRALLSNAQPPAILVVEDNAQPPAILVVEDNEDILRGIRTILRLEGYSVVTATTGLLALDALAHARYHVILLDIHLPVMGNLEFLAAYAKQPGQHSPVIMCSAVADSTDQDLPGYVIGVLSKPVKVVQLLAMVNIIGSG